MQSGIEPASESLISPRQSTQFTEPVVVAHGPTGAGKSYRLASWVRKLRDKGHIVLWVNASEPGLDLEHALSPAPYVAVDNWDPVAPGHRELVVSLGQELRAGHRSGAFLAGRDAALVGIAEREFPGLLRVLRPADLRLSVDDVAGLAPRLVGCDLTSKEAHLAHRLADGWAGFAVLAVQVIAEKSRSPEHSITADFDHAVMTRWGCDLPAGLLTLLAVADVWSPQLIRAADDSRITAKHLEIGRAEGVLIPGSTSEYTLRPLARAVRRHLGENRTGSPPADLDHVTRQRVLSALVADRRVRDAALVAGVSDSPAAFGAVLSLALDEMDYVLARRICAQLVGMPRQWFGDQWALALCTAVHGLSRYPQTSQVRALASAVSAERHALGGSLRDRLLANGLLSALDRMSGEPTRSVTHARLVLDNLAAARHRGDSDRGIAVLALSQAAMSLMLDDLHGLAEEAATEAATAASVATAPDATALANAVLAATRAVRGDPSGAATALDLLGADQPVADAIGVGGLVRLAASLVAIEDADFATAYDLIRFALTEGEDTEFWWLYQSVAAICTAILGDEGSAERLSEDIERKRQAGWIVTGPLLRSALSAQLALLLHKPGLAVRLTSSDTAESPMSVVLRAIGELTLGRFEKSARMAGSVAHSPSHRVRTGAALVGAIVAALTDEPRTASTRLHSALSTMQSTGLRSPLRFLAEDARTILSSIAISERDAQRLAQWLETPVRIAAPEARVPTLSERDIELLIGLRDQLTLGQIADRLGISYNTVKTLTLRLYRKLGVTNRSAAVERAIAAHVIH